MLDLKWIRENPQQFDDAIAKRGLTPLSNKIIELDQKRRKLIQQIQELQHTRNDTAKSLGALRKADPDAFEVAKVEAEKLKKELDILNHKLAEDNELQEIMDNVPNILADDVPYGTDESENKLVRTWGEATSHHFQKHHYELGEALGMMDFEQSAKMSGSRFVTLSKDLARMERALINFMLDINTREFDFEEVSPPYLVRPQAMYNIGQLPKFAEDSFETTNNYRLIPTGEVPLTNLAADQIIQREKIPLRYTAFTPCFRSEAGSAGRDVRGMIRLHQFSKVELVTICTPDESELEHQHMLGAAEAILQRLELPYRIVTLCSGDTGFTAAKTYDIEVWLPAQKQYREIASCSNCGDFVARRMNGRYKEFGAKETTWLHTLNGSSLPIGRTIVAILENYQNKDGTINVPTALQDYMGGIEVIGA